MEFNAIIKTVIYPAHPCKISSNCWHVYMYKQDSFHALLSEIKCYSCIPDGKIQVNPKIWSGLEILF